MTVFKGYLAIANKKRGYIIMYMIIFMSISFALQFANKSNSSKMYSATSLDIGVVDRDNSELSEEVINYMKTIHNVNELEDDISVIQEEMYYGKYDVVVQIPEGFAADEVSGDIKLEITGQPGNYGYIYVKQQLNNMINLYRKYSMAGYSIKESFDKISEQEDSKVELVDINGNGGKVKDFVYLFQFFPYVSVAILCYILGMIFVVFKKRDIKNRLNASAISVKRQFIESILAFIVIGTLLWLVVMLISLIVYRQEFYSDNNLGYYMLNSYVEMLVSLAIAFVIGVLVKGENLVNVIVTPLSLASSFLGGVFVPLSMLAEGVRKVAHFIPSYWYSEVNNTLADFSNLSAENLKTVWSGIGIQLIFVVFFISIALAVNAYQKQER
ncbi:MAG: ABC transporter permease [Lachnospiraceae bacterium]|nr:ABC transporter permease [Lachnospiraceae bacterium]MBQ2319726.1 ABC transporter permease [Lachnospiraceae bacterium]